MSYSFRSLNSNLKKNIHSFTSSSRCLHSSHKISLSGRTNMAIKVTDLKFNIDSTFLIFFRFNIFFIVTTFNHFRFAYVIFSRNWAGKTDVALTEKSYLRCHRDELCTKSIFTLTLRHFLSKSFNYFAFNNRI